ncbi:glycosyltransferase family 39 protein [Nocardioides sp. 1609]|uniref:ArnT family glycosyltransferase n=1 Tax=Nocardioides sp. 1609 TaxID=2508327 RepID=UPI00106F2254|nr:glycosyltransferase family 39 protein [Nocardioides sp. 1609]
MTTYAADRALEPTSEPTPPPAVPPRERRRVPPERAAYVVLLLGTAVLYLWGLGASGWANSFYSAAAQAGSESWKAFLFGASDAAGSITVDKPPLSLWPMALSVRVFGLSSWAVLVPQALMGVASVAVLVALVRRATGSAWAGLLAGLALATTPVAVLVFRFNNPDALLTLLVLGAAYAVQRALGSDAAGSGDGRERALRWLVLGGTLLGLAFLTKTLQAFLVLPAFAVTYAVFAVVPWRRRIVHLLAACGAMVVAAGWWVALVELWPAGSRPYVGGSQTNDFLELTFGYNGFGRLTGDEAGSVGGGGGWGSTGLFRLLGTENGGQVAWLLPAALVLGVGALWVGPRAVRVATSLVLGWLVVTAATFSFMAGIYHAYYTVALAPAIAACVALGAWALWQRRESLVASAVLGFTVALTSAWAFVLLDRTPDFQPWLRWAVVVLGFAAALLVVGVRHLPAAVAAGVAAVTLVAGLAGPTAYAVSTAATPHTGSIPSAGPSSAGGRGAGGPGGGPGGTGGTGGTGVGGLLDGSTSTDTLTALLLADADSYDWVAATVGANSAAGYQLATEQSVMPIGGFNGSDPSPTLAEFQQYVADGRIHYFIAGGGGLGGAGGGGVGGGGFGGGGFGGGGAGGDSEIATWVAATYPAQTVDGVTVYDLTT